MTGKTTFVSSSDANYFPLLREWIHSVRSHPQGAGMDICIMNAGMTPAQVESIRPLVTAVKDIDWPCPIDPRKVKGKEYLKACVARPWIPRIFPGYDVYFWMDADTWVQDWAGVELFLRGAAKGKIALTGQVDRAYPRQARVKWLGRWPWKVRSFYFSNARRAFGFEMARTLLPYHVLLAGAFALRADAPHWEKWQELVTIAVRKGKVFTAEQVSLGVMAYIHGYEFEILPAWTHWLCEFKPMVDDDGRFVEPFLPHNPIGILHMSGWDDMRLDRALTTPFKKISGGTAERSFRYPAFDGGAP